jgi:UPF0755 protein
MKRAAQIVGGTVGLFVLVAGVIAWWAVRYPDRPAGGNKQAQIVVERGTSLHEIARRLKARGIIDHPSWFAFYGNERGLAQKVKAGQYTFSASMSPREVLQKLVQGVPVEERTVTLPEGKNLVQVAELLESAGVSSKDDVLRLARDAKFAKELGVPGNTLEGWLFPDTYRFRPGTPAQKVLAQLVKHEKDVLTELEARDKDGFAALHKNYKWGERELVLMASLVEKETAQPDERPRIAGVFFNRLKLPSFVPHLLQTDPTIVYGCTVPLVKSAACQKFDGRIRRIHLEDRENPYNTYTHEGLPPGPISNPGRAALEAVLKPDRTPYLYFVSKNDGTHYFSKTKAEHEAAVDKYQRHHGT